MKELLRASDLLRTIPDRETEWLVSRAQHARYPRGTLIFSRRDTGSDVMFLVTGRVKITATAPSGVNMMFGLIERGQFFGETSMLDGLPRAADAIAAVDSRVAHFSRADFMALMGRNPEVAIALSRMICLRLRQLAAYVEDAVLHDSGMRLLNRLKRLAADYGTNLSDGRAVRIDHRLSQEELGESVGLTRISVNRQLRRWSDQGLIEYGRGYVLIHDLDGFDAADIDEAAE